MTALIIHGHFYQPPRENPRTGEVEVEPTAAPFHDWNERIHAECYGPNAFARVTDDASPRVVNNYAHISFNFGPTLLSWLKKQQPRTYQRILDADTESIARRGGHGNAIAQAYGHAILPLLNARDRLTHVIWGLEDFLYRFNRPAEAMWLPETACNDETLELLIEQGMRYVILAPNQARRVRRLSELTWTEVLPDTIDTTRPYLFFHRDGSRRSLAIFFYNGPVARAIAFERALSSSKGVVERFKAVAQSGPLVNVATDGETYGHHFKFGDLCLAHVVEEEAPRAGFSITNYGEYLDTHEPQFEVEIDNGQDGKGSSWSCSHGVGRWMDNCGCQTGGKAGWDQRWRKPLREALEFLKTNADRHFETLGEDLFRNPWEARNAYISVVLDERQSIDVFIDRQCRVLSDVDKERAIKLLEVQRNSLLMFTSCGWFFSDLAGIETLQVLRYAERVIGLQKELGVASPREKFLELLAEARSNVAEKGNGAEIFIRLERLQRELSPVG
jgi:alpha-amylase/alpha-mannosidase (GH57 family)